MTSIDGIVEELHAALSARFPTSATLDGVPGYDDRLTDYGEDADERFVAARGGWPAPICRCGGAPPG